MAVLQSVMTLFLLLILARLPLFGSGQIQPDKMCSPESTTAECGTQVDLLCSPSSLAGKRFTCMDVQASNGPNGMDCTMERVGKNVSLNGMFECFLSDSLAGLQLPASKITHTGKYEFYIETEDTSDMYMAHLQINGSKKPPHISLMMDNKKVVCKVDGGCPVGHIEWSDNFSRNWTKNATVEEEDGLIVSTLHLEALSNIEELYCTVSYQRMENTENKTNGISMKSLTGSNDPERVISDPGTSVQILVSICLLACAIMLVVIIWQRRRKYQGQKQPLASGSVNVSKKILMRDRETKCSFGTDKCTTTLMTTEAAK